MTIVKNERHELMYLLEWSLVGIDYRKLNNATQKDHFPLSLLDQNLEQLVGHSLCYLDGYSGFFQIPIHRRDQEKTTFTCPYRTFAYWRMLFRLCNALAAFQRYILAIFSGRAHNEGFHGQLFNLWRHI